MADLAVSIRNLSKVYKIRHQSARSTNFGEALMSKLRRPFRRDSVESFFALKDIDLEIKKGEVIGIIGKNGAGKSTLLKVLSRITEPTTGRVELYGRVGSLLEVGTGFHPELTGRENVFLNGAILGMRTQEIKRQFDEIVDFARIERFLDTPVKRYSSGMYVRLAFAVAAHLNSEILIIDEVLAVGDADFHTKCLGKMNDVARSGRTVLLVSHNMTAINALCDSCALLDAGRLAQFDSTDSVVKAYMSKGRLPRFEPPSGPLKEISVHASQSGIEISVKYSCEEAISKPNLGFVVSDVFGAPIFGSNQEMSDQSDRPTNTVRGNVTVRAQQPKLLDGDYLLTIWFGDGVIDFCYYPNCITFSVSGQAGPFQKSAAIKGPVWPTLEWASVSEDADRACRV